MTARQTLKRWSLLGLTVAACAASAAQAATRPDDRAGALGAGPATASQSTAIRAGGRAGPLGVESDVISRFLVNRPTTVRPDDRAGPLGVGPDATGASTPTLDHGGSSWSTVELAGASALGALLIGLTGFALIRRRRSAAAAAALQN